MSPNLPTLVSHRRISWWLVISLAGFSWLTVWSQAYWLWLLPATGLVIGWIIVDFRWFYFGLMASLPFSIEILLPGGLGTDIPSEPLMWLLCLVTIIHQIYSSDRLAPGFIKHPVSLLIAVHWLWIILVTITAVDVLIALKFLLAKSWYIIVFFMLTGFMIHTYQQWTRVIRWLIFALALVTFYVQIRHAGSGFSFESINFKVGPFFRNHVNYGCMLVLALPYVWIMYITSSRQKWLWFFLLAFFCWAIYFSYTRAAYVAVVVSVAGMIIVHYRQMWLAFALAALITCAGLFYLLADNRFLDFAPDYNKTITHTQFESLISATAKGQDISTMERIYRWVAGIYMVGEKPLTGFGPGNFYPQYKAYTLNSFKTYVSDNPDRSGIHSYYLMTAVEQGLPGLFIFLGLNVLVLLVCQHYYHQITVKEDRLLLLGICGSLFAIYTILLLNDMLETDKVGTFYFFNLAVVTVLAGKYSHPAKAST